MQAAWDTANQVVHDIQSPLSAFRTGLDMIKDDLDEEMRVLFRDIFSRLSGITTSLSKQMKTSKGGKNEAAEFMSVQPLASLLDSLVSEKRLEFQNKLEVNLQFDLNAQSYGVFSAVVPNDFKRIVSNLINNAVEATTKGNVVVSLSKNDIHSVISIKDSGTGMTKEELAKLGIKGVSWKENGSGLGFSYAKKCVKSWNGLIEVDSAPGFGTTVYIKLPIADSPDWFIDKVRITKETAIVILDDDPSIHSSWDNKLKSVGKISIHHFTEQLSLQNWIQANPLVNAKFFIDYEFLNSNYNGLKFIRENKIEEKSVLVTSRADEESIKLACSTCCVKLLPKAMVSSIMIVTDEKIKPDAVILDDDEMVTSTWLLSAKRYKKNIRTFNKKEELFSLIEQFDSETKFYIDLKLSNNDRGEEVAKTLFSRGFKNVFIASAGNILDESVLSIAQGVVSKSPPWSYTET